MTVARLKLMLKLWRDLEKAVAVLEKAVSDITLRLIVTMIAVAGLAIAVTRAL